MCLIRSLIRTMIRVIAFVIVCILGIRLYWAVEGIGWILLVRLYPNWIGSVDTTQPGEVWETLSLYILVIVFPCLVSGAAVATALIWGRAWWTVVGFACTLVPLWAYHIAYSPDPHDPPVVMDASFLWHHAVLILIALVPAVLWARYRRALERKEMLIPDSTESGQIKFQCIP